MKTFQEQLIALRTAHGLKQEEIAKKLGLSQRTYSNYEQGKTEPRIETIKMIADYYQVSTDYLFGRTENPSLPTDGGGSHK